MVGAMRNETKACKEMWMSVIECHVRKAMNNFKMQNVWGREGTGVNGLSLEQQNERFIELFRNNKRKFNREFRLSCVEVNQSRYFLETSQFDSIAEMCGYDSLFVNKVFAMVQEIITYEKELKGLTS